MLADFDRSVTGIAAQPFLLTGIDRGRIRRHVPDLLLVGADGGVTVVDVKAPSRIADPCVREQFAWTRRVGWAFEARSGANPQLLANVRFVAGYRREALIDTGLIPAVVDAVAGQVIGRGESSERCRRGIRGPCPVQRHRTVPSGPLDSKRIPSDSASDRLQHLDRRGWDRETIQP